MRIEPGEIRVFHVVMVLDRPKMKVWHVDLDSKYAEVLACDANEVLLCAGPQTRGIDENLKDQPTALVIELPADWHVIADCRLYTCRIAGYQIDPKRTR